MTFSGTCVIEIVGGKYAPETVSFSFSDQQVTQLHGYLVEAQRLETSILANGGFAVSMNVSGRLGQPIRLSGTEPTDDQRAIFLHRLRPFQLLKEPYHFGKIKNIVAHGTASSPFLQAYLQRTKEMFFGSAMQEQVRISLGDLVLNSEAALNAWLNAVEYHRDESKMVTLLRARETIPEGLARPVFMSMHSRPRGTC